MWLKILTALVIQLTIQNTEKPITHFTNEKVGIITFKRFEEVKNIYVFANISENLNETNNFLSK